MRFARLLLVAVLAAGLLVGCGRQSANDKANGPGIRQVRVTKPPKNWDSAGQDASGKIPEDVVRTFLTAEKAGDWRTAWEQISDDERPPFETWQSDYVDPNAKLASFTVGESRSGAPGVAVVRVSMQRSVGGRSQNVSGQWWPLRQDQAGAWKLTLPPRN